MAIHVRTADGRTEKVLNQGDASDDNELENIVNRAGWPYSAGWAEIDSKRRQFIALDHVVSVETREHGDSRAVGFS
jgi:hypothetical protein